MASQAGVPEGLRIPKKQIYEAAYGKVPDGWVIWRVDGDHRNDNPKNLIAVPRAVASSLGSKNWSSCSKQLFSKEEILQLVVAKMAAAAETQATEVVCPKCKGVLYAATAP